VRAQDVSPRDIVGAAEAVGLDPGPIVVEEVAPEVIYRIAAYGAPRNYAHWSFGRDYWVQKRSFDQGRSKIYEVILPDDPPVAYISTDNTAAHNLLVRAHILGHGHVYRHNEPSRPYHPPGFIQSCRNARARFLGYEDVVGPEAVEAVIDLAHALRHHAIPAEPSSRRIPEKDMTVARRTHRDIPNEEVLSALDRYERGLASYVKDMVEQRQRILGTGETDLLLWLSEYPLLPEWQRDIFATVREQYLFSRGVRITKILHEGFSAWVETKILRELGVDDDEYLEIMKLHGAVTAPSALGINPYALGFRALRHLEERGVDPVEVVRWETDASFVRNHFDEELIQAVELYHWRQDDSPDPAVDAFPLRHDRHRWEDVRDRLVHSIERRLNYAPKTTVASHSGLAMRTQVPISVRMFDPGEPPEPPTQAMHRLVSRRLYCSFITQPDVWRERLKSTHWVLEKVPFLPDEVFLAARTETPYIVLEVETQHTSTELEMASTITIAGQLSRLLHCMVAVLLIEERDGKRHLVDMKATAAG
jgi:stage V sporulation protein R